MSKNFYFHLASTMFFFAGILHLYRLVKGWDMMMGPILIPTWVSTLLVFVTATLFYYGTHFRK